MAQVMQNLMPNPTPTNTRTLLKRLFGKCLSISEGTSILEKLDDWRLITATWFELAHFIDALQALINDSTFPPNAKQKAALVISKVAYCMEDYDHSLEYALALGNEFQLTPRTDDFHDALYVNKIIKHALDTYIKERSGNETPSEKLSDLVNRLFRQGLDRRDFSSVIGLALETRRTDMVAQAIATHDAEDKTNVLIETLSKAWESQLPVDFQTELLDLIYQLFDKQGQASGSIGSQNMAVRIIAMSQCLIKLNRPQLVVGIFEHLLANYVLVAYQLAFDLHENAPQQFLGHIKEQLFQAKQEAADGENATVQPLSEVKANLKSILEGEEIIKHHMQFLIKNNHTDMLILRQIKDAIRGACTHNATVLANGLMHTGTTCDDFLRENLDWISKATNWNKFNAVASLGLIHKGHERKAMKILDPYLPKGDQDQFGYKEGGSLYAYGLIHANHGNPDVFRYLSDQLTKATTSAVRHGASLALGLAALGTRNQNIYEQLRDILYQNEAVSGEAAGMAMGLVMAGSLNDGAFNEMRQYILDTDKEKIQRGLRTGIPMLAYGAMEKAEPWIKALESRQSDAVMRQTAVCTMAMAYVGSGKASVVERLLDKVATDPSHDVKRFAAIAIGFLLSGQPELCLMHIGMLVEHFNPHIRYGAAIAVAIACAGSGYKEAISLIEPLLQAKENFVRQGALIALSFIFIQHTGSTCANVVEYRKNLMKIITEKGEDTITKFGAILAQGILDAGGRNVTISLHNRHDQPDMPAVLGIFVFLQHWYWHSMTHFISLSFRPTCLIGLNKDLKMPKMEFRCNAKPSLFSYPPPLEEKKKEDNEKVETAVLSISNKKKGLMAAAANNKKKAGDEPESKKEEEKMEVEEQKEETKAGKEEGNKDETKTSYESFTHTEEEKPKELPEPSFHNLANPARAVRLQLRKLSMPEGASYAPIRPISQGGIVLFEKTSTEHEEEIVELAVAGGMTGDAEGKDNKPVEAHTPFEFMWNDY